MLAVFSLPGNSFDVLGRGLNITAAGKFATTANNKTVRIYFNATTAVVGSTVTGGTVVADTGVQAGSNVGWQVNANIFKYGAAGSITQYAQCDGAFVGGTHLGGGASSLPMFTTATESGAILIAITGNAATATTDIVLNFSVWPGDAVRATGQWIITGLWKEPFDCRQLGVSVFARRRRLDTAIEAASTTWLTIPSPGVLSPSARRNTAKRAKSEIWLGDLDFEPRLTE